MKHSIKLSALFVVGAVAFASVPDTQASSLGSIRGFVRDGLGNPLAGAAVLVLASTEEAGSDRVVKRSSTDKEGKFIATGIVPGRYRVKAEASGFNPVELAALVKANKATVFDSILLRRTGTLAEETSVDVNPRYAARRASGTIFHIDENSRKAGGKSPDVEGPVILADGRVPIHGVVNTYAETSAGSAIEAFESVGTSFAVAQQLSPDVEMVIGGQFGTGQGSIHRVESLTSLNLGERHRLGVAVGYGRFTFSRRTGRGTLGQYSVSATDTWQVSGPVLIVYGMQYSRFAEGASGSSILPRLGFAYDLRGGTRLFGGLTPGASEDMQSTVNLESGEIVFSTPKPVALRGGEPVPDRSYRLQFGGEQLISDRSSLELMAFVDTVSGHGVGLLAIPVEGRHVEDFLSVREQRGSTRGVRLTYKHRVATGLDASIGYAVGEGQQLDPRGISDPAKLFRQGAFQVISAKIDANMVRTGTRVSTVLRFAPERAVFAIDPFQGQFATYDPSLNVSVSQDLPTFGMVPGQWEAVVDLRNLLDQQQSVTDERHELIASRYHRLVRVGVSVRF